MTICRLIKLTCICAASASILVFFTLNVTINKAIGIINDTYREKALQTKQTVYVPSEVKQIQNKINALAGHNRGINFLILLLATFAIGYFFAVFLEKKSFVHKKNRGSWCV